jgi:chemotaxis protein methyltransferase CheR
MSPENETEALEIRLFLDAISAKYGYDMRGYATGSMRRRVLAALARSGLAHLGELQHRVLHDRAFFAEVIEDLTVRVSEMFRDPSFFLAFRSRVVPLLRTYPRLNVWHCGCAAGEEVYATAIVLLEEGLYDRTQIYATDVSAQALEQAKQALYPADRLKAFAEGYAASGGKSTFSSYFTEAYDGIALRESLRKNILFFEHNLVSDHVFAEMNVVFCRNVLIYFGEELRGRVMGTIRESLCPGGFLCLGSSETLRGAQALPFSDFVPTERIYRHS